MGGMIGLAMYQSCCLDKRIDAIISKIGMAPRGEYDWRVVRRCRRSTATPTEITYDAALEAYRDARWPKGIITLAGIGDDLTSATTRSCATHRSGSSLLPQERRHGLDIRAGRSRRRRSRRCSSLVRPFLRSQAADQQIGAPTERA